MVSWQVSMEKQALTLVGMPCNLVIFPFAGCRLGVWVG